jgi:methionine-S-sulfoxide reductase
LLATSAWFLLTLAGVTSPLAANEDATESAVFAGGCFWCTEMAFEQVQGVVDVHSGYCGGTAKTANYQRIHRGTTGHAEVVSVTYDPAKVRYDQLLDVFFAAHDPTQLNRQGEDDVGKQYRSAIFYADDEQKQQAEAKIQSLQTKKVFGRRIVTKLEPLVEFFPAEAIHQDFARRNFYSPYIQTHALPRACNVRELHPELIAPGK